MTARLPRENLFRSIAPGATFRDTAGGEATLAGHFAVFNEWSEIDSMFEGHFMEQIAPGAFTKTIAENAKNIKVTFNHGRDPSLGNQTLGSIETLKEDAKGAAYEVALNRGIPELLMDGLRKGQYGASFRFNVLRDERVDRPKASKYNPRAIPERTITEAQVHEFGPVSFPQYPQATAGVRSITDEMLFESLVRDPARREQLMTFIKPDAVVTTPHLGAPRFSNDREWLTWLRSTSRI